MNTVADTVNMMSNTVEAMMRLQDFMDRHTLCEEVVAKDYEYMGNSKTRSSIDAFYRRVMDSEQSTGWYGEGKILSWQAAMNAWLNEQNVDGLQRLDDRWRGYVTAIHYEHYLNNKRAQLMLQQINVSNEIAKTDDELAGTAVAIEGYLGGKIRGNPYEKD